MAELGEGLGGYLDVQDATLRAPRLEAVSNIGIANTAPQHAFSVGSNLYVDTESSNVLTVDGNVVCEGVKVGLIEIIPSYDLAAVSNVGNVTQSTIQFSNATTGFVTTANIEVGTANLFVDTTTGNVGIGKTDPGSALDVVGDVEISSNLAVDTNTLFVDSVGNKVGIGTTNPTDRLDVHYPTPSYGSSAGTEEGSLTVSAGAEFSNAVVYFRTPFDAAAPAKRAIFSDGGNFSGSTSGGLHFCLESTNDNSTKVDLTDSKMVIKQNGNVGIGTTGPTRPLTLHKGEGLHITDTSTVNYSQFSILDFNYGGGASAGTVSSIRMLCNAVNRDNGAGPNFDYGAQGKLFFQGKTNNLFSGGGNDQTYTNIMTIDGATKTVGIGTTGPTAGFNALCTSNSGLGVELKNQRADNNGYYSWFKMRNLDFGTSPIFHFKAFEFLQTQTNGYPLFLVEGSEGGNFLYIEQNGNVGIGTNNPTQKLHVETATGVSDNKVRIGSSLNSGSSQSVSGISFGANPAFFNGDNAQRTSAEITSGFYQGGASDWGDAYLSLRTPTNPSFGTINDVLTIRGGLVGIRTTTPNVRLDFGSPLNNRIINLYGSGGDGDSTAYYGFGINSSTLRYNTISTGDVHKFYGDTTEYGYINDATGFVSTFTGQHKSFPHETLSGKSVDELSGLIVCASGEHISVNDSIPQRGKDGITVSEAVPIVCLSSYMNEKTVFGVVSNVEDPEDTQRNDRNGAFTSTFKKIVGDTRIYVNSLGEGAVWVCNTNGSLVNGDYITTSNVAGYGQKQDSDTLKNYTVAKITMDCDFRGTLVPKKQIKKKFVTETLQETVKEEYEDNMAEDVYTYDVDGEYYVKTVKDNITTKTRPVMQDYELRDSDGNVITETISKTISAKEYEILVNKEGCVANISGYQNEDGTITVEEYSTLEDRTGYSEIIDNYTQTINQPVTYSGKKIIVKTVTHEVDDLDEHGNLQWEDHPTETETAYKIRYLDADGNITDEANHVYKAAFVGCTYHCG